MPIESSWANPEKTIIHIRFSGMWTLEDYHAMIDQIYKMLRDIDHPVHYVSDFSKSQISTVKLLSAGRHMEVTSSQSQSSISVAVGANGFLKAMGSVVQKLFIKNTQMYYADSMDEAFQIIARHEAESGDSAQS